MKKKEVFLILDGNALLHRAWHAIPPLTAPDGRVVNAVYGFTNVVEKMREVFQPDYMAVAWDLPGKTFRHEAFEEYKGTRKKKEQELYDQIPMIQEILNAYHVSSLSAKGMEADDLLGTLAKKFGPKKQVEVKILTGDLDALQLVRPDVEVVIFKKGLSETKVYDEKAVKERYGLKPSQLIDLKALMGDSSDNIPGLAGVGQKTATNLLQEYGSIEEILKAVKVEKVPEKFAKKFRGQEEEIKKMKHLVTIVQNVQLPEFTIKQTAVEDPDKKQLLMLFEEFGFRRLLEKYRGAKNQNEFREKSEQSRKMKMTSVKNVESFEELNKKTVVVSVVDGQKDLFGGSVQEVALFDGEKMYQAERPDKKTIESIGHFLSDAEITVGHDLKAAMYHLGVIEGTIFDTMVAAYLLNPGIRTFDLVTIAKDQLGETIKSNTSTVRQVQIVYTLHEKLIEGLEEVKMTEVAEKIEMPLVSILFGMERDGIEVDQKRLQELSKMFGEQLEGLKKNIHKLAGREFNINSPTQLADILFEDLGLSTKGIKKTKTGISTAASELEKLWDVHEIVPLIGRYREFAKLKSTYVDALPDLIAADGRIHTSYNQTVTATGRLSSSDPNLQNIPIRTTLGKEIRKAFIAEKGSILVAMDYSQFELRLAAVFSKDKLFIKAFQEGADIHARTAAEVLGKDEKNITKAERSAAKAINFGILYGMGSRNLAQSTGFSQTEAKAFIEQYFAVHPEIGEYIEYAKEIAHKREYAETLFGRRRYLPEINSGVRQLVAAAERMAVNMPIQGTQADLVKMAMIDVYDWIQNSDFNVKMLLQVHDELIFEVKEQEVNEVVSELQQIMEGIWKTDVPLVVDVEIGNNWGDLKNWK